jgi:hypothetical protein
VGVFATFWDWLKLGSKSSRQELLHKYPIRNGMIGGGGALAFISFQNLFMYLLTGDSFQLWLFFPYFYSWSCLSCLQFCDKKLIMLAS